MPPTFQFCHQTQNMVANFCHHIIKGIFNKIVSTINCTKTVLSFWCNNSIGIRVEPHQQQGVNGLPNSKPYGQRAIAPSDSSDTGTGIDGQ